MKTNLNKFAGLRSTSFRITAVASSLFLIGALSANAQTFIENNGTGANLNLGTAWSGGVAPTGTTVADFEPLFITQNTGTYSSALAASANWAGIAIESGISVPITLTVNSGSTLSLGNPNGGNSTIIDMSNTTAGQVLNLAGPGSLSVTGTSGAVQEWDVQSGDTLNVSVGTITAGGNTKTLELYGGGNINISSNIGSGSAFNVLGLDIELGTNVTLSGNNAWVPGAGLFQMGSGTLNIGSSTALNEFAGQNKAFTINGGTITAVGGAQSVSTGTAGGFLLTNSGGGMTVGGSNALSFTSTFTTSASTTLTNSNTANTTFGAFNLSNSSSSNTLTLTSTAGAGNLIFSGVVAGSSSTGTASGFTISSGTVQLNAANTYSGATSIASGALVELGNTNAAQSSAVSIAGTNGLAFASGIGAFNVAGLNGAGSESLTDAASAGVALTIASATTNTYTGKLSGSGASLIESGAGNQTLSGSNSFTGGTTINSGTVTFAQTVAMPATGTVTANSGGTLGVNAGGTGEFTGAASGAGSLGGIFGGVGGQGAPVVLNSGSTVAIDTTNAATGSVTYLGTISNSGVNLTKLGTGTLVLSSADTFNGATTISGGILQLGNTLSLQNSSVTIGTTSGLTFSSGLGSATIGAMNGSVTETLTDNGGAAVALTIGNNNGSGTYTGAIVGLGSLTKAGTGTEVLSGANTFSGNANINGGVLSVANIAGGGQLGSGTVTMAGGELLTTATTSSTRALVLNSGTSTLATANGTSQTWSGSASNAITGSGAVQIGDGTNTGTIVFGSVAAISNTFSGGVIINSGDLQLLRSASIGGNGVTGSGPLSFSTGGTGTLTLAGTSALDVAVTDLNGSSGVITTATAFTHTLTVNTANNDSFGGVIQNGTSGSMALIKSGTGTLVLTGNDTFTGALNVTAGSLVLSTGSLGGTTLTVSSGAALQVKGNYTMETTAAGKLNVSGGTSGGGTLSLVDGTAGNVLTLANTTATTSGSVFVAGSTTSGQNSTIALEIGATSDEIVVNNTNSGTARFASGGTPVVFSVFGLGNLSGTTQTIFSAGAAITYDSSNTPTLSTSGNYSGYTLALVKGTNSITLTEAANAVATNAYWNGNAAANTAQNGTTAWNSFVGGNSDISNFGTGVGGTGTVTGTLAPTSNVFFDTGVTGNLNTTLGQNLAINSLTFSSTNTVTVGGTNTLTIEATNANGNTAGNGVTVATGAASDTISSNVALGGNQTWTVTDSTNTLTASGAISGGFGLTKAGAGMLLLSGSNSYTGATTVAAGNLRVSGSTASGSAFTVGNGTAATAILSGTGTISGNVSTAAAAGGDVAYLAPGSNSSGARNDFGSAGTLHVGGSLSLGTGTNLDFDLSSSGLSGNDQIAAAGSLTLGTALTFNYNELSGSLDTANKYQLITFGGTAPSLGGVTFTSNYTGGTGTYTAVYSIDGGGQAVDVAFNLAAGTPTAAFFNGQGTDLGTFANFDTTVSSGTAVAAALGSTTNVSFNANRNATVSTATLNSALDINSLTFGTGSAIHSGMTINGTGTITVEATTANGNTIGHGVTVNTGGGNNAINTAVALDNDQSWTVTDSTSTLLVGGVVSGAHQLTTAGSGVVNLASATGNTYTGGTVVSSGALLLSNSSNSATGTGTLTVNAGATVGGYGSSSGASFSISGTGTATGSRANVLVGMNSLTDSNTTHVLTLAGTGASTIADANLTFNLNTHQAGSYNSDPAGSGTELSVGSTAISFGAGQGSVQFTLNMQNEPGIVAAYTPYVLVAGTLNTGGTGVNGSQYSGLTLGTVLVNSGGVTETIITGNNLQLAFGSAIDQSYYANSYMVLYQSAGVDDIDVVVVPEPGTWAMMLGGLAVLVIWQRRRSKI